MKVLAYYLFQQRMFAFNAEVDSSRHGTQGVH